MKYVNKDINQSTSEVTIAIDLYSASAELLEIVACFFDFQQIKEFARKTQKPSMYLLISIHPASHYLSIQLALILNL